MELNYDWRGFQSVFGPSKRPALPGPAGAEPDSPIYLVSENDKILAAFSRGDSLDEWLGAGIDDMIVEFSHREFVVFDRAKVDESLNDATALPHFYEQVASLGQKAAPQIFTRGNPKKVLKALKCGNSVTRDFRSTEHFLLESIHSWWAKVLPSAYGVFLRLEGSARPDFLVLIRRGKVDSFCEPDLSSMGSDRCRQPADVVKYLSEKYLVPIQGVFVSATEWSSWTEADHPWRKVAIAVRANQAKLVPFRWGLVTLMAARAFLEI